VPWNAVVLQRVRHLHLRARTLTDGLLMGEHRSRRVGAAVEFADYQEYIPGMDLRSLDWKALARTDRFVVKRYHTETELPCMLVVDLSGDLSTGRAAADLPDLDGSKAGYAITLAATLAYFLHRHGEPVGLEVVAGESVLHRSLPPRRGRNHLQRIFLSLAGAKPGGAADLSKALFAVGARTRRRSWVTVITDGMEEPARWLPALAGFARRKSDLIFAHVYDPKEWRLDVGPAAVFFSPEGGEGIPVDPAGAAEAFDEVAREYVDEVRGGVVKWGGRYVLLPTDRPLEQAIQHVVVGGGDPARAA
jgi:uncharacterized protein (DUF58 family)